MAQAKIFVDEDVHDGLAQALRDKGIDALNVREAGRREKSDRDQLLFAVSQGRAIMSFNLVHFEALAVEWFELDMRHYGIIVSPQREFRDTLTRCLQLLSSRPAEQIENQLIYL